MEAQSRPPIQAVFGIVVADLPYHRTGDFLDVHIGSGAYLSTDQDKAGSGVTFAGNAGMSVLFQAGVENGVGDLVADFIRMSFGHRLGSEGAQCCWHDSLFSVIFFTRPQFG